MPAEETPPARHAHQSAATDHKNSASWLFLAVAPLAVAAGWIVYSRFGIDGRRTLPEALTGQRFTLATPSGSINLYADGPTAGRPILLVHSINAAASSYEVRPLYGHFARSRPVYAIDLPGFGFSDRLARVYEPRDMVDAILAAAAHIRKRHGEAAIDLVALSLSCEYAARATLERPQDFRSLGMISPTGFDRRLSGYGRYGSTKRKPLVHALISVPLWSRALFDLVASRPSMRFFLEKTFGSKQIDEGLFEYDQLTAHQPGAEHAVWSFLSGSLFPNDISRIYPQLTRPVWAIKGTRGDFVDYRDLGAVAKEGNWIVETFEAGALPHFEKLGAVVQSYERFQNGLEPAAPTPPETATAPMREAAASERPLSRLLL